jgi:hypothetical protein
VLSSPEAGDGAGRTSSDRITEASCEVRRRTEDRTRRRGAGTDPRHRRPKNRTPPACGSETGSEGINRWALQIIPANRDRDPQAREA